MEQMEFGVLLNALPVDLILWGVLGVVVLVFGVYSAVLLWHWKIYSTGRFTSAANMFVYLGVSAGFLMLMVLAATWYSVV